MKSMNKNTTLLNEIIAIIGISIFTSLLFNYYSGKRIPLIREPDVKLQASDSLLFPESSVVVDTTLLIQPDTSITNKIKIIAPLHEQALKNSDSSKVNSENRSSKTYTLISLDQLKRLIKEKRGMLIDARNGDDYIRGHIKDAHSIPALDVDKYFSKLVEIPKDTVMILYCNNAECHLSHLLADFLRNLEFNKIFIYENGWDGWISAGLPVDTTRESD